MLASTLTCLAHALGTLSLIRERAYRK